MTTPDSEASLVTSERESWEYWHGTPELFAHVVRTAERATSVDGVATTTLIDVCVSDDHEVFDSPTAFTELVTIDALRHFSSISATVTAGTETSEIMLRWTRPWWKSGMSHDAEVILTVTGEARQLVVRRTMIRRAILRGGTRHGMAQGVAGFLFTGAVTGAAGAVVVSGGFLLGLAASSILYAFLGVTLVATIVGIFWASWGYPSIEVAPVGQSNLRRILRVAGPIVVTVILAGITKKLFG